MTARSDIEQIDGALGRFPERAVRRSLDTFRRQITPSLKTDTGGDFRLSGLNNIGKLSMTLKVTGSELVEGRLMAGPKRMRGPWRWLEDGTRPRATSTGRTHPGTPAKRTWSDPVRRALPAADRAISDEFQAVIR